MIISAPCGKMKGFCDSGIMRFLGIPYAQPPVGRLRFRSPEPAVPWSGIRPCLHPGHVSPQLTVPGMSALKAEETPDESCLFLNVYAPDKGEKQPVLFWIHGGAFQTGSGDFGLNPSVFVKDGIITVSANYRLGALGFLDFERYLGPDYRGSGNNGILDIIQALRWTRENIAAFGGDPDRITIMGQSAGAKIAAVLTLMKEARGLFRQAVLCSGAAQCIRSRDTAEKTADRFMRAAGLTEKTASRLLTMSWKSFVTAQQPLFAGFNLHTVGPAADGIHIEETDPLELIRRGASRDISLLTGTNRDEIELYDRIYEFHELDEDSAERLFGIHGAAVLRAYEKIPRDADFHKHFIHFMTEVIYRAGTVRMAEAASDARQPVYLYRLDWDRQPYRACHASESQFLMGESPLVPGLDSSPAHDHLSSLMRQSFLSFIRTGVPAAQGLPVWPPFETQRRLMMVFDGTCRILPAPPAETPPDMPYCVFSL